MRILRNDLTAALWQDEESPLFPLEIVGDQVTKRGNHSTTIKLGGKTYSANYYLNYDFGCVYAGHEMDGPYIILGEVYRQTED